MTEEYTLQLSTKFGDHDQSMLNIRARTEQEFNALLQYLIHNAGTIVFAAETVGRTALEGQPVASAAPPAQYANAYPAQVPQQPPGGAQPAPAQQPQQTATGHPHCAHGPMTHKTGFKNNKAWAGYFCPAPQGQPRCAVVWS